MKPDFEAELTDEDEADSKEQYWEDEYEDREGENTAATVEDKYIEVKTFKCQKCGRRTKQRATFLFKPMCCGHQMTPEQTEKKTGFKELLKKAKKASEAAKKAKAKPKKAKKAVKKARKPKTKPSKAKKNKKTKAGKKRRR
ncbi:hypothetical protein H0O03_03485 [Candidatus Micrarchaeota archaeon]|nr:hypothetical protein [Candidatus Micrarchaeota archaeon]